MKLFGRTLSSFVPITIVVAIFFTQIVTAIALTTIATPLNEDSGMLPAITTMTYVGNSRYTFVNHKYHQRTIDATLANHLSLTVELALNTVERQLGLMHRTELLADHGMLFVFPFERMVSFWMKDTFIPLSIAYLDSTGTIVSIHDLEPQSEVGVPSHNAVTYALEVNQGFFTTHRIDVGDRISITDCSALNSLIDGYDEAVVDRVWRLCQ